MPWLDRLVAELLAPLAAWVFVSGLDDLFLDLSYLVLRARDRLASRRVPARAQAVEKQGRIAILVPCWQEGEVIERMVEHNLAAIDYADYEIWLGVYPNDPKSIEKARRCEAEFELVHSVVCERDGPTTKADCLNQILQGLFARERESGLPYDVVVQHDAEDLIHPQSLRLIDELCRTHDMVQLPVFALPTPLANLTHGVYCDEFAESHLKDLWVRSRLGGFVPSAGVGTAFRRDALDRLRIEHGDELFNPESLTEDYFVGLELHRLGCRQVFALREVRPSVGGRHERSPVATRAYFPRTFGAALRQRTRWLMGNNLQAWQRFGWGVAPAQLYWLWRDRKGLLTYPTALLANLLFLYGLAGWAQARAGGTPWLLGQAVLESSTLTWLLAANLGLLVWRQLVRGACVWRLYGAPQALTVPLRAPWGNAINFLSTVRAVASFARARLQGRALVWAKTSHVYPSRDALRAHSRRLGEVLVSLGYVDASAVERVLRDGEASLRLGEALVQRGVLDEDRLYQALAMQHSLAFARIQSDEIDPGAEMLYRGAGERLGDTLAFRIEQGRLWIAGSEPPAEGAVEAVSARLGREVRFVLITPDNYQRLSAEREQAEHELGRAAGFGD